ncbi:MAG: hypothetical protein R6X34_04550, partial [Chloroflexota bacterium]
SPRLPWAATVILVTAVVTDEILIVLTRLQEAGRKVVLISLAPAPPPKGVERILTYHIPANAPAFKSSHTNHAATAAALSAIPTPESVNSRQ